MLSGLVHQVLILGPDRSRQLLAQACRFRRGRQRSEPQMLTRTQQIRGALLLTRQQALLRQLRERLHLRHHTHSKILLQRAQPPQVFIRTP